MIKNVRTAIVADDDILFFDKILVNVIFSSDEMGILSIDLGMNMILRLLFMSDLWLGTMNLNNAKRLKKI